MLFTIFRYTRKKVEMKSFKMRSASKRWPHYDTLATAVPDPMAIPISAFFSAGASLTPSPVIATLQEEEFKHYILDQNNTNHNVHMTWILSEVIMFIKEAIIVEG